MNLILTRLIVLSLPLARPTACLSQDWTATATSAPRLAWQGVASSVNGEKLVAVAWNGSSSSIYTSTNSDRTWILNNAPALGWTSVASSWDGTKLVAVGDGLVYTSTNSGCGWISSSPPNFGFGRVASSADREKLVTVSLGGCIYSSTNAGITWRGTIYPAFTALSLTPRFSGVRALSLTRITASAVLRMVG